MELHDTNRAYDPTDERMWPSGVSMIVRDRLYAANQRADQLQRELEIMTTARTEAEMREIFRLADEHRSGFIDADKLSTLSQAVNPSFTRQKLEALIDRMHTSQHGNVSFDDFVELVQKVMEGLSEPAKQTGIKTMRAAAEGAARKAQAEVRANADAAVNARVEAEVSAMALVASSSSCCRAPMLF